MELWGSNARHCTTVLPYIHTDGDEFLLILCSLKPATSLHFSMCSCVLILHFFITLLAFFFFFQCSFFTFIWQHFDFTLPLYKYSALGPCHAACFDVQRCWISKPEGETCQNKYTQDERKDISSVNFLMIKLNYFGHYGGFLSLQAIFLGWTWKEWYCTLKYQLST